MRVSEGKSSGASRRALRIRKAAAGRATASRWRVNRGAGGPAAGTSAQKAGVLNFSAATA